MHQKKKNKKSSNIHKQRKNTWWISITHIIINFILGANITTIICLWISAASIYINPSLLPSFSLIGLMFPILCIVNLCFLILWLIVKWKYSWLPILGFIACIGSLRTYFPINIPSPHPKGCLQILSYNVHCFLHIKDNKIRRDATEIGKYLAESKADIICLQEATLEYSDIGKQLRKKLTRTPYMDSIHIKSRVSFNNLVCYSRYPIIDKEVIFTNHMNGSVAFKIKLSRHDTIIVINNHLESNSLSDNDIAQYKEIIENPEQIKMNNQQQILLYKISHASRDRAEQSQKVANYIKKQHLPIFSVGDFNETPISYTYNTMKGELEDAFTQTGIGPGFSFENNHLYLRLDNIHYSPQWKPYGAKVDKSIRKSDHYPIYAFFKRIKD